MRAPVIFVATVGIAATLLSPAGARVEASRIVDRTFSCEAGFVGGLHQVTVRSGYSTIPNSSKLKVYSGVSRNMFDSLASLHSEGFNVHRGNCAIAKARVALTTKTLRGGVVPPLGAEATCVAPTRVLLRVRASFTRPPTIETTGRYGYPLLTVTGALETSAIAVATRSGTPIAYLSVTGAEKARFFTRPTCKED